MSDALAHALERAWLAPPRWLLLLLPLEWLFAGLTGLRREAFRRGWLARHHPGVPVVVVGNITVGGTGKTPVVIALVRSLQDRGWNVAVISRGYGGRATEARPVQIDDSPEDVGDEALLIAVSTDAPVYVGKDRAAVARLAATNGAQLIVSDDGLQHYRLERDIEIVTMDAGTGFGNGHLLPVGPLREPPRRMASVDFVLERGGAEPATALGFVPRQFHRLHGDEERPLENPGFGPRVHAIAGIARPARFFDELRKLGFTPEEHALRDHRPPDRKEIETLRDLPLLMTSKDEVKCPRDVHADAWVLEMELQFPAGFLQTLHERLAELVENTDGVSS